MRWFDSGDRAAWPLAVGVFVVTTLVLMLVGLGLVSLLIGGAAGAATHNLAAARSRRQTRTARRASSR